MQYKVSKFNNMVECDNEVIIFNSLSQKIIKFDKDEMFLSIFRNGEALLRESMPLDEKVADRLITDGFIIPVEDDELNKSILHVKEIINRKKLVFTILTTEQCNFRCKYCYEKFEKGKMSPELQEGFVKYLASNLNEYDELQLRWFGGEPLMAIDVIERISLKAYELCNRLGKIYSSEIVTNGYLLTIENFRKLLDMGIARFKVTLDGPEDIHDNLRVLSNGAGTFSTILGNLRNIKNNIDEKGIKIIIRSNISTDTLDELDTFLHFLHSEFGDDPRFTFKFKSVDNLGGDSIKKIENKIIPSKELLFDKLINSPFALNYDAYFEHINSGICRAGKRNNYVLGPDGLLFKCLVHFGKDENKIGRLETTGVLKIDADKLLNWVERTDYEDKCRECKNSPRCIGGKCIAKRIFNSYTSCVFDDKHVEYIVKLLLKSNGIQKIEKID